MAPPITCHVLDQTTGRPARAIPVFLTLLSPSPGWTSTGVSAPYTAITDADGRVKVWAEPQTQQSSPAPGPARGSGEGEGESKTQVWALRFETGPYWGGAGKTFYPEVEVRFYVREGEHYHVPLLLGPWSYTTYRGS